MDGIPSLLVAGVFIWVAYRLYDWMRRRHYAAQVKDAGSQLFSDTKGLTVPIIDPVAAGYRPLRGERLVAVQEGVARVELRRTGGVSSRGTSVSIPIVKGLRYRLYTGNTHRPKTWQPVAQGRLLITDKALVFEGSEKGERLAWEQVAKVELRSDGFIVARRSGPARNYTAAAPDPHFAAILLGMSLGTVAS